MNTLPSLLVATSAAILFALGAAHLALTFFGQQLDPRDDALRERMAEVPLRMTRETTMWRAWVGFNASHSLGALLFGLLYGYFALAAPALLFGSAFLQGLGLLTLVAYLVLAVRYWFSRPLWGVLSALALYALGLLARHV
jgi:hypothetical protein